MKIGVISNFYPPHSVGGYERLCAEVSDELATLGHSVAVLTSDFGGRGGPADTFPVDRSLQLLVDKSDIYRPVDISAAERAAIDAHNETRLQSFILHNSPDLVFCWNLYFLGEGALNAVDRISRPKAFFLTDNWLAAASKPAWVGSFFQRYVHGEEHFTGDPAAPAAGEERQMTNSLAIFGALFVEKLYRSVGLGFDESVVIHNGVHLPMVPDELKRDNTTLMSPKVVSLLFAGRVVDVKGLHIAVRALAIVKSSLSNGWAVKMDVVGDTQDASYLSKIRSQIADLGLTDDVEFRPPVPESRLVSLFNDHDIFLFPSLYEPFSLTLIHAMASGIPVVASDVGGNLEIIENERSGLIYQRSSPEQMCAAILRLVEDGSLRERLGRRASHTAQRFSFRRMVRRVEQALKTYVETGGEGAVSAARAAAAK